MKTDERKKIKSDAKSKASEVLAQENEAMMKAKLEELFDEVLFELATVKTEKDKSVEDNTRLTEDLENLKSEKEELASQKAEFEAKAEELQHKLEAADVRIRELESHIETMRQEAALQARVAELEEAGLLSAGKAADKQKSRIKVMDDEAFAEYKSELLELKESWAKNEAKTKDVVVDKTKDVVVDKTKDVDADVDPVAVAALAELAELDDIDETKISATQLLKLKKAAAALNAVSLASIESGEEDNLGIDTALLKEYEGLWDEDGGK